MIWSKSNSMGGPTSHTFDSLDTKFQICSYKVRILNRTEHILGFGSVRDSNSSTKRTIEYLSTLNMNKKKWGFPRWDEFIANN